MKRKIHQKIFTLPFFSSALIMEFLPMQRNGTGSISCSYFGGVTAFWAPRLLGIPAQFGHPHSHREGRTMNIHVRYLKQKVVNRPFPRSPQSPFQVRSQCILTERAEGCKPYI